MVDYSNATEALKTGSVAVIPTDTIYGIVGQAFSKPTVKKVYKIKKRDTTKPCIVLISGFDDLNLFGISEFWQEKAKRYWPGPVSLIFPTKKADIEHLTRQTGTIALRLPADKNLRDLLSQTGPLIAPSANPEGCPPATNIEMAKKYFGNKVDHYLDGGDLSQAKASTLIDLTNNKTVR